MWICIDASGMLGVFLAVITGFAQRKWGPLAGHAVRKGRAKATVARSAHMSLLWGRVLVFQARLKFAAPLEVQQLMERVAVACRSIRWLG